MHISSFMIPKDKVATITEWESIEKALEIILERKISAIVVMDKDDKPLGIVTKTDFVDAYKKGVSLQNKIGLIMVKDLDTILESESRDRAAAHFERQGHHHAIVVNLAGDFVGLISAWDVAAECARDSRAWPWIRTEDGRAPVH